MPTAHDAGTDRIEKQVLIRAPRSRPLVEFTLDEKDGGTLLTVVESGFDRIPLERRALAYRMNDEGWGIQVQNIKKHVEQTA